ncbi:unnamed protein product (macronuclear) [Paramecium tetraurelia]|uniref:Uncharacterized protein n=1 Tax=Paramecium tetraurelia TaxID=5888 RepID=A0DC42_PARTE|nr:uncharacterized protein GSPATT00015486001 [Paramecium tetraurelia]CAK80609.1 unnamed protein product [Paramecium tetraurelia]|eukprot:XP_001448006.1 hypothetical protein (macronuclear) [Paramecium tetraurelia strain d4-2]
MIKLIDLEGWSDYSISPYINQLKQLSESPEITPTKREKLHRLPSIQQKKLECYEIQNYKSGYFANRKQIGYQVVSEERKSQKLTKQYTRVQQQQYQFQELSSFVESPKKPKKMKELQDCLFQRRSYRLKIKNKMLNLTQKSPLKNISQLLRKLNSEVINKNDLVQILDK